MKGNHTPTPAMKAAAKKGLQLVDGKKIKQTDVEDLAHAGAKKIASGHKLSDEHVRAIAAHHHNHAGACPSVGTGEFGPAAANDLMWGGPAGAMWANTRVAAMDSTMLEDETVDLDKLFNEGVALSFEIFGSTAGEKMELDENDDGLLWAPILRSGTLAMRPGPGGQKIHDPLVFVPGHSADARKEIGLEDLKDAFEAGAIQHVTLPTTHENKPLDNTGFIEQMKMTDSTMRPGEKVLMGAHRFTEPDVLGRVQRGSVANRSCGILYDFTNTETGTVFPAVIEHVCLTNRPFLPGMEPYGALQDLDFSDRTVVPMLLSEVPQSHKEELADSGSWDGSAGRFTDEQYQKSCLIKRSGEGSIKERCSLPVREPSGAVNEKGVEAAAAMIGKLTNVSLAEKRSAAKKIVSLYKSLKKNAPPNVSKLASVSTNMSEDELRKELLLVDVAWADGISLNDIRGQIVAQLREMRQPPIDEGGYGPNFYVEDVMANPYKARVTCDYGFDFEESDDNWVVPFDVGDDGKVVLSDFSQWLPVKSEWVVDEEAKNQSDELDELLHQPAQTEPSTPATKLSLSLPADSLERASQERRLANTRENNNPIGGRSMSLTRDQIGAMDLSDEARTLLLADQDDREREKNELSERRKKDKENEVKTYLADLGEKGLKDAPGFLREVERALLGDDGHVAARLDLSDDGGVKSQDLTLSEIVKRIIGAIPLSDEGTVDRTKMPNLLQSPLDARPPQDPEKPEDVNAPKTGEQLAETWAKDLGGNLDLELAPVVGAAAPADNKGA